MLSMVMIKAVQLALGSEWKPDLILLPESERGRKRQYEAFFKTNIWFENETWAISVPPSRLMDPIRKAELRGTSRQIARSVPPSPARDLIGSLRDMIRPSLQRAYPDIGHAAALAGVSVSTLQRRLRELRHHLFGTCRNRASAAVDRIAGARRHQDLRCRLRSRLHRASELHTRVPKMDGPHSISVPIPSIKG